MKAAIDHTMQPNFCNSKYDGTTGKSDQLQLNFLIGLLILILGGAIHAQDSLPCQLPEPGLPFLEASVCENQRVQFSITDTAGIHFSWEDTLAGTERYFRKSGTYILHATNACGSRMFRVYISFCDQDPYIPIGFSPNGDGINDIFRVRGPRMKAMLLEVFNRKGNVIFGTSNQDVYWDGTHAGIEMPAGVYLWRFSCILESGRKIEQSGPLTLIR